MSQRNVSRKVEALLYLSGALSYVVAGIAYKGLLNWVVGPLWVVVWIEAGSRISNLRNRRRHAEALR